MTDLRVCSKCGTANEHERTYCWVCFDKFENGDASAPAVSRALAAPAGSRRVDSSGSAPWTTFSVVATGVAIGLTLLFVKSLGVLGVFPLVLVLPLLVKASGWSSTAMGTAIRAVAVFFLIVISSVLLVVLTCFGKFMIR